MKYNPDIHHRHSMRLKDYDYSENGAYFVTICTQNRENLFGMIANGEIQLNNAGEMIEKWWQELKNKFANIELDEWVVMPNHFHGIIQIVGADLRVCPDDNIIRDDNNEGEHAGSPLRSSVSTIIQWFKTMTTNEYIRGVKSEIFPPFNKNIWQRNYHEHIIRDENELNRIREYIINNPENWETDDLFTI